MTEAMERRFAQYHHDNPHVYVLFKKYALQVAQRGHPRFSAKAVFERLRWHLLFETKGDVFKLNNNYTAYYARMLMQKEPRFKDFFRVRDNSGRTRTQP